MAREPEAIAGLRRALGECLATFRKAAELTQDQLAKATFCDRSQVAHLERGAARADERFWAAADETARADGSLLLAFHDVETEKQRHEHQVREAELAAIRAKADRFRRDRNTDASRQPELARLKGVSRPTTLLAAHAGAGEPPDAMAAVPSPEATVAASQGRWRSVRGHLIGGHATTLAKQAAGLYGATRGLPQATTVIALPSWMPSEPMPIEAVTLEWEPKAPRPVLVGEEAELCPVLPLRTPRRAFGRYTSAMRYLSPPRLFENRPSYRLLDVSFASSGTGRLRFGLSTFFDKLDVSEALSHEFAAAMAGEPSWEQLPFRALLTEPFDLTNRTAWYRHPDGAAQHQGRFGDVLPPRTRSRQSGGWWWPVRGSAGRRVPARQHRAGKHGNRS